VRVHMSASLTLEWYEKQNVFGMENTLCEEVAHFTYHSHGKGARSYAGHDFVDLVRVDSKTVESVWTG
jgi:hypothetical protein